MTEQAIGVLKSVNPRGKVVFMELEVNGEEKLDVSTFANLPDVDIANGLIGKMVKIAYDINGKYKNLKKGGIKEYDSELVQEETVSNDPAKTPEARVAGLTTADASPQPKKDMVKVDAYQDKQGKGYSWGQSVNIIGNLQHGDDFDQEAFIKKVKETFETIEKGRKEVGV